MNNELEKIRNVGFAVKVMKLSWLRVRQELNLQQGLEVLTFCEKYTYDSSFNYRCKRQLFIYCFVLFFIKRNQDSSVSTVTRLGAGKIE
jgi:hypothetical protein